LMVLIPIARGAAPAAGWGPWRCCCWLLLLV
jgi:hypothetical protein